MGAGRPVAETYFILNSRGVPVIELDPRTWALWYDADPRRHVLHTAWETEDGMAEVDTCFTGFDLRPRAERENDGLPQLWDTVASLYPMHTRAEEPETLGIWRWETEDDARKGHEQVVHEIQMEWGGGVPGGNGKA